VVPSSDLGRRTNGTPHHGACGPCVASHASCFKFPLVTPTAARTHLLWSCAGTHPPGCGLRMVERRGRCYEGLRRSCADSAR